MSRSPTRVAGALPRFPRVSGDEPRWHYTPAESEGFSPRERG